jgi:copper(I)-binding protein
MTSITKSGVPTRSAGAGWPIFFVASALLLLPAASLAAEAKITASNAWSRATSAAAKVGVGYITIRNDGDAADRLVSVGTPAAEKAEMHETKMENGMMQMRPLPDGLAIPAHETVTLGPGSTHLMLMGLKQALKEGESFPARLVFEHAGKIEVTFQVEGAGAMGPGDAAKDGPASMPEGHHHH